MKKLFGLFLCLLLCPVFANAAPKVAITVNDFLITDLDVQKRMKFLTASSGIPNSKDAEDALKSQVIDMMIDESLIEQDAKKQKLKLEDGELEDALLAICNKNGLKKSEMVMYLKAQGSDLKALEAQLSSQLYWNKIMDLQIRHDVSVTDQEVSENAAAIKDAIKSHSNQNTNVNLSEIVLYITDENHSKVKEMARNLSKNLRNGADFEKVAEQFSQAPTATSRGLIGWVYVDHLSAEIASHVVKAHSGFITEPIVMKEGSIHILKINAVKNKQIKDEEIDPAEIRNMLLDKKFNLAVRAYMTKLRDNAYIRIKKL